MTRCSTGMAVAALLLLQVIWGGVVLAQPRVEASVNATEIGEQERLILTLRIDDTPADEIEIPDDLSTSGLVALHRVPSTSHQINIRNGVAVESLRFVWAFQPISAGTARIDPITVTIRGVPYETQPIRVRVTSQADRGRGATESRLDDDVFGPNDIFIRASASKQTAYLHEQVVVEYRLFFREGVQLRQSRLAGSWDAPGFWREELDVDLRPVPRREVIDGLTYQTIVLKRVAMFPTREGRLSIQPLRIETEARPRHGGDLFDAFLAYRNRFRNLELSSPELTIDVIPLPEGAPPTFAGAVGRFEVQTRSSDAILRPGDPLTRRIDIRGSGNIAMIESPTAPVPDGFETMAPRVVEEVDRSGTALRGRKTFDYVSVPSRQGTYELPPLAFSYFDPVNETYRTVESASVLVEVQAGSGGISARQPAESDGPGILRHARWERPRPPLHRTPWAYAPVAGVLLAWLLIPGVQRARQRQATARVQASSTRQMQAWRSALWRIESNPDAAAALHQAQDLLGAVVGAAIGTHERVVTARLLTEVDRHPDAPGASHLRRAIVLIEQARFAPGGAVAGVRDGVVASLAAALDAFETSSKEA